MKYKKRFLKWIASLLVILLLIGNIPFVSAAKEVGPYISDVKLKRWYYAPVTTAYLFGLMDLTAPDEFSPKAPAKKADVIYGLWRIAGNPIVNSNHEFTDINQNSKYYDAVQWAYAIKLIEKNTNIYFRPNQSVTREEMCRYIKNFYIHCGIGSTDIAVSLQEENEILSKFTDSSDISSESKSSVAWAVKNNVLSGKGTDDDCCIAPQDKITRAELAAFLTKQAGYHCEAIGRYFNEILNNDNVCAIYFRASKIEALKFLDTAIYELMKYMDTQARNPGYYNGSPWCCGFVYYCADQAGLIGSAASTSKQYLFGDEILLSCTKSYNFFNFLNQLLDANDVPHPGDLIYYQDYSGICHIGIVVYVNNTTGQLYTIEGNTYNHFFGVKNAIGYHSYNNYKIGSTAWPGASIYAYARPFT